MKEVVIHVNQIKSSLLVQEQAIPTKFPANNMFLVALTVLYLQTEQEEMWEGVGNELEPGLLHRCHLYCAALGLLCLPFGAENQMELK